MKNPGSKPVCAFLKVSYSDVGEVGVAVNCEKNTIFPEHPVFSEPESL